MAKWKKLAHVVYQCSYHIVRCPKYRFRILKGKVGEFVESKIRKICEWKKVEILELNVREDHIYAIMVIPPKISISEMMGLLKGKTAMTLFKSFGEFKKKPYWGNHFWSRGYCISTIGLDEDKIRRYVKYQEENEWLEEDNEQGYSLF
jgi:putative transposase